MFKFKLSVWIFYKIEFLFFQQFKMFYKKMNKTQKLIKVQLHNLLVIVDYVLQH